MNLQELRRHKPQILSLAASLSAILSLAACAQPSTLSAPAVTPAELAAEQNAQENYLKDEKAKGLVHLAYNTKPVANRLDAVARRIAPAAVALCRELALYPDPRDCAYGIHASKGRDAEGNSKINASADGKAVYINTGMVRFTKDDNELAYIIGHEFAHNIMKHIDAQKQNAMAGAFLGALADGIAARYGAYSKKDSFTAAGAESGILAYSPAFEQEADYIGLYLTARAGYDYHRVPDVWRRMSLFDREFIYYTSTHPSNAERFVLMRKFIAEIDAKKAAKAPLFPEFKQAKK